MLLCVLQDSLCEKYEDVNIAFDMVSIQFSFHYSFETISQAMKMLENVSQNLKTGGVLIGTLPDANEIVYVEISENCSAWACCRLFPGFVMSVWSV